MATTLRGLTSKRLAEAKGTTRKVMLLVFSVGGRRMAAKADEVGGVWPWTEAIPVPSVTPFMTAVLRRGEDILPVFDLAGRLNVQIESQTALCLIAKRRDGPMAVRIDGEIPALQLVDEQAMRPVGWRNSDVRATCRVGLEELPIYSLAELGASASESRRTGSGGGYA